jgi:ferredoxin-type protein NapG
MLKSKAPKPSRRNFLKQSFSYALDGATQIFSASLPFDPFEKSAPELIRPPGALPEKEFLAKCTRCDECVKVCPEHAIMKFLVQSPEHFLTPILNDKRKACETCAAKPCIEVCVPHALVKGGQL